jgi:hypothetical protein
MPDIKFIRANAASWCSRIWPVINTLMTCSLVDEVIQLDDSVAARCRRGATQEQRNEASQHSRKRKKSGETPTQDIEETRT